MKELVRTNDAVFLSYLQARLREIAIESFVFDEHINAAEGNILLWPRRVMVTDEDWEAAKRILEEISA